MTKIPSVDFALPVRDHRPLCSHRVLSLQRFTKLQVAAGANIRTRSTRCCSRCWPRSSSWWSKHYWCPYWWPSCWSRRCWCSASWHCPPYSRCWGSAGTGTSSVPVTWWRPRARSVPSARRPRSRRSRPTCPATIPRTYNRPRRAIRTTPTRTTPRTWWTPWRGRTNGGETSCSSYYSYIHIYFIYLYIPTFGVQSLPNFLFMTIHKFTLRRLSPSHHKI